MRVEVKAKVEAEASVELELKVRIEVIATIETIAEVRVDHQIQLVEEMRRRVRKFRWYRTKQYLTAPPQSTTFWNKKHSNKRLILFEIFELPKVQKQLKIQVYHINVLIQGYL